MTTAFLFALTLAPATPQPLTDYQQRDIGCVATLGIIAHEQANGNALAISSYPDVRDRGKVWAGKAGVRIMEESGQPREVIALAIQEAVNAIQAQAGKSVDPKAFIASKVQGCIAEMDRQLTDAAPVQSEPISASNFGTDEPDKIALYRRQLGEDLASPHRIRYCQALVKIAHAEIVGREGSESRDAVAFAQLVRAFDAKAKNLPSADKPKSVNAEELVAELEKEPSKEEKVARCLRLGETLALALPPE